MIISFPTKAELLEKQLNNMGVNHITYSIRQEKGFNDYYSMYGCYDSTQTFKVRSTGDTLEEAFKNLIVSKNIADEFFKEVLSDGETK